MGIKSGQADPKPTLEQLSADDLTSLRRFVKWISDENRWHHIFYFYILSGATARHWTWTNFKNFLEDTTHCQAFAAPFEWNKHSRNALVNAAYRISTLHSLTQTVPDCPRLTVDLLSKLMNTYDKWQETALTEQG